MSPWSPRAARSSSRCSPSPARAGLDPVGIDLAAFGMIRALAGGPPHRHPPAQGRGRGVRRRRPSIAASVGSPTWRSPATTPVSSPASPSSACAGSPRTWPRRTDLALEHAEQWLVHVGLDRPARARSRAIRPASPRPATTLESEPRSARRRATPLARLLRRPGGRRAGRRRRSSAAGAARSPALPRRSALARPRGRGRPTRRAGRATATADAARLTLPYGLALEH